MGKSDGFLTAKAIGNRMKAKGLQKLRWFCQVCEKQCRDENGFKCHTTSESHQRQMLIVANNPDKFLNAYSNEFETTFLENLRRRHGTKRMAANVVYNEFIADKLHIHMNATQWTTLASFVQYLGRTGKCVVDETEKGWFMQYIDRDPRTLARQEEVEKKKKAELDHEERNRLFIERQLKIAQESTADKLGGDDELRPTKLMRRDGDTKISIALAPVEAKDTAHKAKAKALPVASVFAPETEDVGGDPSSVNDHGKQQGSRTLEAMAHEFEQHKSHESRKRRRDDEDAKLEYWITTSIVVKLLNKRVGDGRYYKQKGEIVGVKDRYGAKVEMLESGDVLQLDQDDLETVIPKVGRQVKIVNGIGRGNVATLLSISVDEYCASIRIDSGSRRGEVLDRVDYESICRLADEKR